MMPSHHELARLCQAASGRDGRRPGLEDAVDIGALGPRAFVKLLPNDQSLVVFRATADRAGWAQNAVAKPRPVPGLGRIHQGFEECWRALRDRVRAAVGLSNVVLTGHSQGGALAIRAALELPNVLEVVTFGAPRVGDADFVAAYRRRNLHTRRFVYQSDPVPFLPPDLSRWPAFGARLAPWLPAALTTYRHVVPATWYNGSAWAHGGPSLAAWLGLAWRHLVVERRHLWADHAIENYVEALANCGRSWP